MADRGTPIPIAIRLEIKQRRSQEQTVRTVARSLGLSKSTVVKYGKQFGTNSLNAQKESA